jgi:hypothetical protein
MPYVKRSIATTLALLTAAACRANADEALTSFSWLAPADYLRWTRQVMTGWQPPRLVQELIDITLAKPLALPPGEHRVPAGRTRFGWPWVKARFDKNQDDVVTRQEFVGPAEFFDRLDRNRDGLLRADDFDWSQPRFPMPPGGQAKRGPGGPGKGGPRPPGSGPGQGPPLPALHVFRTIDDDDDGRISAKEWSRYFEKLAKNKGYVTLEDMRKEVAGGIQASQRERTRAHRLQHLLGVKEPVDPARVNGIMVAGVLLRECLYGRPGPGGPGPGGPRPGIGKRPGPLGPGKRAKDQKPPRNFLLGPQPGEPAPEFTLSTLDGQGKISLSDYRGRAVVLIFGSLT